MVIALSAFSQKIKHPGYVKSHFREIQTKSIMHKLKSNYNLDRFEILSNYNNGVRFIFPTGGKYKWKVWKSTTKEDYFVVISLHRDKKTGDVKSSKLAFIIIDLEQGIVHDLKISKNYYLYSNPLVSFNAEKKFEDIPTLDLEGSL